MAAVRRVPSPEESAAATQQLHGYGGSSTVAMAVVGRQPADARQHAPQAGGSLTEIGGRWIRGIWEWGMDAWAGARRWADGWWRRNRAGSGHRPGVSARRRMIDIIDAACRDEAAPARTGEQPTAGGAAAAQARIRATREDSTVRKHRAALGRFRHFLQINADIATGPTLEVEDWDVACEAFVTALVAPAVAHEWSRPRGWPAKCSPRQAASVQQAAVAGLRRLGWLSTDALPLTAATKAALGCRDPEDVQRAEMIFPWEVFDGAARIKADSPWKLAARALIVMAVIMGNRPGTTPELLVGHVRRTTSNDVVVVQQTGFRHKPQHARATRRGRRAAPAFTLEHWAIREFVQPWLAWLREDHAPESQLLFPSLVRETYARARSSEGRRVEGGLWLEPLQRWSPRQVTAALDLILGVDGRRGRTMQGLRSGTNVEMRKLGKDGQQQGGSVVSDVTRRTLQGRSLREQLGSEAAYFEPFADEIRGATRQLGTLRIVRRDGALVVEATRAPGPGPWVELEPRILQDADTEPSSSSDGSSNDTSSEEDSSSTSTSTGPPSAVKAAGGQCGRCGKPIGPHDHGWVCDYDGPGPPCRWTVCPMCHRGGARAALYCDKHRQ